MKTVYLDNQICSLGQCELCRGAMSTGPCAWGCGMMTIQILKPTEAETTCFLCITRQPAHNVNTTAGEVTSWLAATLLALWLPAAIMLSWHSVITQTQ